MWKLYSHVKYLYEYKYYSPPCCSLFKWSQQNSEMVHKFPTFVELCIMFSTHVWAGAVNRMDYMHIIRLCLMSKWRYFLQVYGPNSIDFTFSKLRLSGGPDLMSWSLSKILASCKVRAFKEWEKFSGWLWNNTK